MFPPLLILKKVNKVCDKNIFNQEIILEIYHKVLLMFKKFNNTIKLHSTI